MTKARTIADLGTGFVNISDTGTEGTKVASGTTAQRGTTAGQLRFNSDTGLAEYYTGTIFKAIDSPPTILSVVDTNITDTQISANFDLGITGTNFSSGATVKFIGNDGTEYNSPTITVNSSTSITARVPTSVNNANEPFDVKVINISNLSGTLENAFNVDASPIWQTASGQVGGTIYENVTNVNTTISATDPEGDVVSYSATGLPTGVTINSNSGLISGIPTQSIGADTTFNITATATSSTNATNRGFTIVVKNTNNGEHLAVTSNNMIDGSSWFNRTNTYYGTEWNNTLSAGDLIEKFWWRDSGNSNANSRRWFLVVEQKASNNFQEAYIVAGWRYVTGSSSSDGQIETFLASNAQTTVGSLLTGNKFVVPSTATYGNGVYHLGWVTNDTRDSYSAGDGAIYVNYSNSVATQNILVSGARGTISWIQQSDWSANSVDYPDVMGAGGKVNYIEGLAISQDAGELIHINMGTA
jgi:hypothetical protein